MAYPPTDTKCNRKNKSSKSRLDSHASSPSSNKLEELLPPMLNQLTPSNLKRATSNLMKEWERSLYPESEYPSTPSPVAVGKN